MTYGDLSAKPSYSASVADEVILPDLDAMIWSAATPDRSGPPLLVMMHGHGGVEHDLAPGFAALPTGVLAVSLRGPVQLRDRWTWFDHQRHARTAFDAAARGVLAWIETLPEHKSIGLLGFSQGGAMAIHSCASHLTGSPMP